MKFFAQTWPALKVHPLAHFYKEGKWESFGIYGKLPFTQRVVAIGVRLW